MLLTLFLGSLGVSALFPLYYIIVKKGVKKGRDARGNWTFHEDRLEPLSRADTKVKIRPVRAEGVVCQICMGKLKSGLPHIKCGCGKVFHITCLKRTGFCPYCQKVYTPEEVEVNATYPDMESMECPMCGRLVYKDSSSCECGAIIADEDGKFYCPGCGTQIDNGEKQCPYCHESFEDVHLVQCPFCGKVFDESRGSCECGTFLGEVCPECGVHIEPEDRTCPSCGVTFEVVDGE
ncbi:MAG: hypothetical protein NT131_05705 [Methanomassiliicoccales archaeon]|nr:hypothetical protein [Methanomassiliicoccales archaeon]